MNDGTAIVGIGASDYFRRGESYPRTLYELIGDAIVVAAADAGIPVPELDGFAFYSSARAGYAGTIEAPEIMANLGIREVGFSATLTGGGGSSAGAIGLASAAIRNGDANHVVTVMALQQGERHRIGKMFAASSVDPNRAFITAAGLSAPAMLMAPMARRHMHEYGTRREAFAEIAINARLNASNRPKALMGAPISLDEYFGARMIAEPLCLYDCCMESDAAVAFITTSSERARDLRQKPAHVMACVHGGEVDWGTGFLWEAMSDDLFASSGNRSLAPKLYGKAGIGPADVDVALIYDHFTPLVVMQLEDYGFCRIGEGGPFVESGAIRMHGTIPVNPHGGHLAEAYVIGATHILEAVEQVRGTAINQVPGAEIALVTGGPSPLPNSSLLLRS